MIRAMINIRARNTDKKYKHLWNFPAVTLRALCYLLIKQCLLSKSQRNLSVYNSADIILRHKNAPCPHIGQDILTHLAEAAHKSADNFSHSPRFINTDSYRNLARVVSEVAMFMLQFLSVLDRKNKTHLCPQLFICVT
jgi:hypothetical protein